MGDEQGYTLDNLLKPLESELDWFSNIRKKIEEHTALLCFAVLMIKTIKLISTICMLMMALMKEGVAGLLAVLTLIVCPAHPVLKRYEEEPNVLSLQVIVNT